MYILGNQLANGYFDSFTTLSNEQAKAELMAAWATPEQQIYNLMHKTCRVCNGQGYESRKIGGGRNFRIERDNIGCYECKGTGAVLK